MAVKYTGIRQFDFQIARFAEPHCSDAEVKEDLTIIGSQIQDIPTWNSWWAMRAYHYQNEGKFGIAASYFKAAIFYMDNHDSRKEPLYQGFIDCFYKSYTDFAYERAQVPYGNSCLPTLLLKQKGATRTLLVLGGFDGYLEEVAGFFKYMKGTPYNILIFDGPGQGNTAAHGLRFIPNFELPVSKVLDYFHLTSVDAIGLSWGGYLVMRAAAFEKRIKRVVAMDIFYSPMDTFRLTLGWPKFLLLELLLNCHCRTIINVLLTRLASKDVDMKWKLNNGAQLTGETTPYALLQNFRQHNAGKILKFVNQDCLLLAGENDQYVPASRLKTIQRKLTSAKHVVPKLFTQETGADQHCQVGRMDLAFAEIRHFLNVPAI